MAKSLAKNFILKSFGEKATEAYGPEEGARIFALADTRYKQLQDEHMGLVETGNLLTLGCVAIYQAMADTHPDDALSLTRDFGRECGEKIGDFLHGVTRIPGMPELLWKHMDKIFAKMSDGYDTENVYIKEDECGMDVVMCPLYEITKDLGCPEACQMICATDKVYMSAFRHIAYSRTMSVAEGDSCCDYRLRYDKTKK